MHKLLLHTSLLLAQNSYAVKAPYLHNPQLIATSIGSSVEEILTLS